MGHFNGKIGNAHALVDTSVSILDFIGAKDGGGG